ncbi:MAG: hypothetical protein KQH67_01135 [Bacteroidetes bacterium]|nr:hypothetical protein [Bacteroidota bacterium]
MTRIYNQNIVFLIILIGFFNTPVLAQRPGTQYIFIGHCYQINTPGDKVDYRLEAFDFSDFAGVWLGGDVCSEAMLNYSTVAYIDSLFNLGNAETHWSLGNHDARNMNWEWYEEFTGRETYYSFHSNGTTRIVMNSNLLSTNCEMLNEQFEIIQEVCDTIAESMDLVLLMHHGLWRDIPGLPNPGVYAQSDLRYWNANCDSVNTQFVDVIYPRLIEVKQRGVNVTCILGDMGASFKKFDVFSDDSVRFMGCGLYHNEPEDNVLFIEKPFFNEPLRFTFHNLDSLLSIQ